jgi:hypothetical protein
MNVHALSYPIIYFSDDVFQVVQNMDALTTSPKSAVRDGKYEGMLIVDTMGQALKVRGAKQIGRAGIEWVLIFPVRLVKVVLEVESFVVQMSVDEVREQIYNSRVGWHGLESMSEFPEIEERIKNAKSVAELIQILS